jgi:exodeoxyribonuclease-5
MPNSASPIDQFEDRLAGNFPHQPTAGQGHLIHAFSRFLFSPQPRCALIVRGYAGTGKTTSIGAFVRALRELGAPTTLLAPTGRAAKVMQSYAGKTASTIHREIYRSKRTKDGSMAYGLAPNLKERTVFIVDEASMIGESGGASEKGNFQYRSLLDDLMEFVFTGEDCRLVLVGDDAQLPPVGHAESPALNEDRLRRDFSLTVATVRLTDVVRQELDSGILSNAHQLRLQIDSKKDGFPQMSVQSFSDIHRLHGLELQETIEDLYGQYGEDQVVIITRSNKRANQFNQQIRNRILWREDSLEAGDRLMVVKNNYFWLASQEGQQTTLIANGDILIVQKVLKRFERFGAPFAEAEVRILDAPTIPPFEVCLHASALQTDTPSIPPAEMQALYEAIAEDYIHLGSKPAIHKAILRDPCYQALQVKFAWALTCHKAQGGQWPAVIVDQGYLQEDMVQVELLRWFYTAFTRSQEKLFLLNFSDSFFSHPSD